MKIKFTFVFKLITMAKKVIPNAARQKVRTKVVSRKIFILMLNNHRLAVYTNALACVHKLTADMPKGLYVDFPSYSTINRGLRQVGDCVNIPTPLGIYSIERSVLFTWAA